MVLFEFPQSNLYIYFSISDMPLKIYKYIDKSDRLRLPDCRLIERNEAVHDESCQVVNISFVILFLFWFPTLVHSVTGSLTLVSGRWEWGGKGAIKWRGHPRNIPSDPFPCLSRVALHKTWDFGRLSSLWAANICSLNLAARQKREHKKKATGQAFQIYFAYFTTIFCYIFFNAVKTDPSGCQHFCRWGINEALWTWYTHRIWPLIYIVRQIFIFSLYLLQQFHLAYFSASPPYIFPHLVVFSVNFIGQMFV